MGIGGGGCGIVVAPVGKVRSSGGGAGRDSITSADRAGRAPAGLVAGVRVAGVSLRLFDGAGAACSACVFAASATRPSVSCTGCAGRGGRRGRRGRGRRGLTGWRRRRGDRLRRDVLLHRQVAAAGRCGDAGQGDSGEGEAVRRHGGTLFPEDPARGGRKRRTRRPVCRSAITYLKSTTYETLGPPVDCPLPRNLSWGEHTRCGAVHGDSPFDTAGDRGPESSGIFRKGVSMTSRFAVAGSVLVALVVVLGPTATRTLAQARAQKPAAAQKIDEEYTKIITQDLQDPRITTELVDHLPASDTVPTPLKFLGRAVGTPGELTYAKDIHRYYEALAKASPRAQVLEDRHDRGRPRHGRARDRRRGDDQVSSTSTRTCSAALDRSAQDDRGAGAAAPQDREADLLHHERHPLARDRRPRDADRAGVPPDRRGDAVHPEHPQQRDHAHHAGHRSGRPREAGRHLLLQQDARAGRRAAAADVLGQVRPARQQPRRHGAVPRAHAERHEDDARVAPDRAARPARSADLPLRLDRHRAVQRRARPDRRRTNGGCSPRTT